MRCSMAPWGNADMVQANANAAYRICRSPAELFICDDVAFRQGDALRHIAIGLVLADELQNIYLRQKGVDPAKDTIAYCRIGERSSHTWFVLKYLLGLNNVKNYDGSWTEYGNVVAAPIEKSV